MAEADPKTIEAEAELPADETAQEAAPRRRWGRLIAMLSVPVLIVAGGTVYWFSLQGKVTTDNAYVKQDKISISALVGGTIVEVLVRENQTVEPGALLFRIDRKPFEIELASANADIATAQADLTALSHNSAFSGADIAASRENIAFAEATLSRQKALWERGFTTKAEYEAAQHVVAQAKESLRLAQAEQNEARAKLANGAAVPGLNPRIAAAQAHRAAAELDLSRTDVRAPIAGRIGQADRLKIGQQVVPNLPVLTLVGSHGTYVEANFKETDLADMRVGQRAEISFDAYPKLKLKGHVDSIGAGTNSEFSILPAQNASGNWVKVTQRVPVRIAIDEKSPREMIAGLSADVTVFTGKDR